MYSLTLARLMSGAGGWLLLVGQGFWLWMLIDCMKNEGPRSEWRYVLFFGNVAGALAYFVARWLPNNPIPLPGFFRRWTYKQKLWNAKAAVHNIGNAHQYGILGDVYFEMGDMTEAQKAYQKAIEKNPKHQGGLWGLAQISMQTKDYLAAKQYLDTLNKIDPEARFGEVSLLYGKVLVELQEWQEAKVHLERDIRHWSHPESSVMLAKILIQEGQREEAKDRLETMIARVQASPMYHHRRHQSAIQQAKKLLRSLNS